MKVAVCLIFDQKVKPINLTTAATSLYLQQCRLFANKKLLANKDFYQILHNNLQLSEAEQK